MSSADQWLAAANPFTAPVPDETVDAALHRVMSRAAVELLSPAARRGKRGRARTMFAASTTVVVAALVFALVNVLPSGREPGVVGTAWAKNVIRRTNAVLAGTGTGVLHVQMVVHQAFPDANGGTGGYDDYAVEIWTERGGADAYWAKVTSPAEPIDEARVPADTNWTTVAADRRVTSYDQSSDTLAVGIDRAKALRVDPATQALAGSLGGPDAKQRVLNRAGGGQPPTFGELLRQLIDSREATVDGIVSIDGAPAIRISAQDGVSVYVDPQTYRPLQISTNRTPHFTETVTFGAYEVLPAGSVTAPDLQALHPYANMVGSPRGGRSPAVAGRRR